MTIHFLIFTIHVRKRTRTKIQPLPGYQPTAKEQWLDRKASFTQIM